MISDILVFLVMVGYVVVCPYTKVEESFNMQAIFDLIHFGGKISSYDHLQFPGVVPRTFIGSIAVGAASMPIVQALHELHIGGVFEQMACRIVLGGMSWVALLYFRNSVQSRFSKRTAQLVMVFTALQFHVCFYATRTLPNTFASICTLVAFGLWLEKNGVAALCLVGACAVIFRCDMIVLVGSMALVMLVAHEIPFFKSLLFGILACLAALLVSVLIDSFFWQKFLWPEGVVLRFNTVENKSSKWGVSPWHWYFTGALPKGLHFILGWVLLGCAQQVVSFLFRKEDSKVAGAGKLRLALYYLAPAVLFIALYSYLPHKELRFILPVFPLFTLAAAVTADSALQLCSDATSPAGLLFPLSLLHDPNRKRRQVASADDSEDTAKRAKPVNRLRKVLPQLAVAGSWLGMLLLAHVFLLAAQHNYPGGEALEHLLHAFVRSEAAQHLHYDPHSQRHIADTGKPPLEPSYVHIDNLAATTGVTRFLQERIPHFTHIHNDLSSSHSVEHVLTTKATVPLPTGYPPHKYLNSLPAQWARLLEQRGKTVQDVKDSAWAQHEQGPNAHQDLWFLQEDDLIVYSKDEHLLPEEKSEFDFIITEDPEEYLTSGQFVLREAIRGFDHLRMTSWGPQVVLTNKLFILENTLAHEYAVDDVSDAGPDDGWEEEL